MLFGRKKPGFVLVEPVRDEKVIPGREAGDGQQPLADGEKPELMEYLASLPDVDDPFEGIESEVEEEPEEKPLTEAQKLAAYIRLRSQAACITGRKALEQEIENFDALIVECSEDETCRDIKTVQGNKDLYYYSTESMSDNYAKIASLVEEKDLPETIAQMVRFNCKTYPVPTPWSYFNKHPYFATDPQLERAKEVMDSDERYKDIRLFENSQGKRFFYADSIMSERYAKALAEDEPYTD